MVELIGAYAFIAGIVILVLATFVAIRGPR